MTERGEIASSSSSLVSPLVPEVAKEVPEVAKELVARIQQVATHCSYEEIYSKIIECNNDPIKLARILSPGNTTLSLVSVSEASCGELKYMEESPSNPSFSAHHPQVEHFASNDPLSKNSEKSLKSGIGVRANLQIRNMDRLSCLPDEILALVLSYLDMKSVVLTSVLSRPWREVWKLVPELDFSVALQSNGTETKEARCILFVEKVLDGHKGSINRFHLSPDFCSDIRKLNQWIKDVIDQGAKELSFTSNTPGNSESPPVPESISESKIEALTMKTNLKLPELVCMFPRLRILSLSGVQLPDGNDGVLTFDSCNLRRLCFRICHFSEAMKVLKVACENLKQFVLETTFSDAFELKLHAPCLTSVEFSHTISSFVRYSLEPLPKLVSAKIASSSGPFYSPYLI